MPFVSWQSADETKETPGGSVSWTVAPLESEGPSFMTFKAYTRWPPATAESVAVRSSGLSAVLVTERSALIVT